MRVGVVLSVILLAASAAVTTSVRASTPATVATCGKWLPPDQGMAFGAEPAWSNTFLESDSMPDGGRIDAFAAAGRRLSFATFSTSWHNGLPFPGGSVREIWAHGQIPLVRISTFPTEDFALGAPQPSAYPGPINHRSIVNGDHDAELRAWARAARATNIPIGLDYDPEMNNAHPWGARFNGGGTTTGYGDPNWPDGPELYRDAYRRIVTIFREQGATNVTFFFHPDTVFGYQEGSYTEPYERFRYSYPGDDYIDWVGLSLYSHPIKADGGNASFEEKLQTFRMPGYEGSYSELASITTRPIAINELGFDAMPSEAAKAAWVADASAVLQSGRYPRIKAINWWGVSGGAYNAWPGSSPAFSAAFKSAFDQPFFDAKLQFSGNCLPGAPAKAAWKNGRIAWSMVGNATRYEVWRGSKRIATTTELSLVAKKRDAYRVRALDPLGAGPFARVR